MDTRICPEHLCVDLLLCRSVTTQIHDCVDLQNVQICEETRGLSLHRTSDLQNLKDTCRVNSCVSAIPGQGMKVCKAMELSSSRLFELQGSTMEHGMHPRVRQMCTVFCRFKQLPTHYSVATHVWTEWLGDITLKKDFFSKHLMSR